MYECIIAEDFNIDKYIFVERPAAASALRYTAASNGSINVSGSASGLKGFMAP